MRATEGDPSIVSLYFFSAHQRPISEMFRRGNYPPCSLTYLLARVTSAVGFLFLEVA